ncbi:ABC transporter permease subunit [Pseudoroseomonas wenyumeiae]|uniref:ABC transporter permease n=1 Tax=Teichococcus wenyumeiae TaxID=2478470 RepID=A0A3A9JPS6_9PROT|nr:ABC transporter permease [Pseudoroseomonas wenyumeiae]RKK05886.1 ABC transporter permease [Pseudoroseomonas wenyumeiae]RMI25885.1 ABC transporter permease subunit [Pseudoroseomonas wenyumeiae]
MEPLKPVSAGARVSLGIGFFAVFIGFWGLVTYSGLVPPLFLASPGQALASGWALFTEYGFVHDIGMTVWRVLGGFLLAAVVAVPLGLMMGSYKSVEAFFEPFISFARYLPASAFIPLLILWAGVGEAQKLSVIFLGSVFQIVIMVAVIAGATRVDLVEAAYTLGARSSGILRRVIIPSAAPQVMEALRLVLGWAWTYVIVAELIGAESGIGHMIMDSQRLLDTGQMIFGIVIIGLIGLITDFLFKALNRRLFRWASL